MEIYIVIATPPRGDGDPWISDVFSDPGLAQAYVEAMDDLDSGVLYDVERHEVRTSLDRAIPDEIIKTEPFFEGLGDVDEAS